MMTPDESVPEEQAPPKGIDFVFETAVKAVEKQLETIDRLDAKIGVVWGLQSASVIWLLGSLAKGGLKLPCLGSTRRPDLRSTQDTDSG